MKSCINLFILHFFPKNLKVGDRISFGTFLNPFSNVETTVLEIANGGLQANEKPIKLLHDRYDYLLREGFVVKVIENFTNGSYHKLPDRYADGTLRLGRPLESYFLDGTSPEGFIEVTLLLLLVNCNSVSSSS